jgi:hypothetical protein
MEEKQGRIPKHYEEVLTAALGITGQTRIKTWQLFEYFVADIFRALDAKTVRENADIAGHQVDIYVEEQTSAGLTVRYAVECKSMESPVGKNIVSNFASIIEFLSKANYVDKGIMVSQSGYTKEAYHTSKQFNIDIYTIEDLEARLGGSQPLSSIVRKSLDEIPQKVADKLLFTLMPFDEKHKDIYIYGIRGAAEKTGFVCRRADEISHNGNILDEILDQIDRAAVVVAEMTEGNPNVYYEVGRAHEKKKEVILLTKDASKIPFDLSLMNHIVYGSISDLEKKLIERLSAIP